MFKVLTGTLVVEKLMPPGWPHVLSLWLLLEVTDFLILPLDKDIALSSSGHFQASISCSVLGRAISSWRSETYHPFFHSTQWPPPPKHRGLSFSIHHHS